ncbi:hypothetical protein Slin15195_G125830 [Septoria linicola]|uniref:Uncharacterized protein n=1 Tax=Septoria linicola TaxID=215465 RepID=A0A9Q9EQX1_9PEZI|nr:hypothetical protein Slin14017_G082010 [Septoria linicola]USW59264.1 hypothetical protein Slin15195_G125830 [Septoria linicola]
MAPWLRVLEAYAVQALLRTPAFHRGVEKVAKQVHRIRHGLPYEEPGGTNLSDPSKPGFGKHFMDELRGQIGQAEREELDGAMRTKGVKDDSVNVRGAVGDADAERADQVWQNMRQKAAQTPKKSTIEDEIDADSAWRDTQSRLNEQPKAGFMSAYIDAMKEQVRNGKPPR